MVEQYFASLFNHFKLLTIQYIQYDTVYIVILHFPKHRFGLFALFEEPEEVLEYIS